MDCKNCKYWDNNYEVGDLNGCYEFKREKVIITKPKPPNYVPTEKPKKIKNDNFRCISYEYKQGE